MLKKMNKTIIIGLILGLSTSCALFPRHKQKDKYVVGPIKLTKTETIKLLKNVKQLQEHAEKQLYKAAKHDAKQLCQDFPTMVEFDLKPLLKAERFIAKGKWLSGAKVYEKLLDEFPESILRETALKRLFKIGNIYIEGQEKKILGLFRAKAYEEGAHILNKITEEVGLEDSSGMGVKAALSVVRRHEKQGKFDDANLKWLEISTVWQKGELGQKALLGLGRTKRAAYNAKPKEVRPLYDGANLKAAKTYYEKFQIRFPKQAKKLNIEQIISDIDQQLANKELAIAKYYQRTGHKLAANIYFDMVIQKWPKSTAAKQARKITQSK